MRAKLPITTRIAYGKDRRHLGYLPPCARQTCEPPCPCSARIQPVSFAFGDRGIWVIDSAKERLALFRRDGEFVRGTPLPGIGYRAWDVQVGPHGPVVASQDLSFDGRITFVASGSTLTRSLYYDGAPIPTGGSMWVDGENGYIAAFEEESSGDRELALSFPIDDPSRRRLVGEEAPGRPLLDGWLLLQEYRGDRVIRLVFEGEEARWEADVEFLTKTPGDDAPQARGIISWETEVASDGTIHILVRAARPRNEGYWYLQVSPDGAVGEVFPLDGPRIEDDQQSRRLTLDGGAHPSVMWAGRKGVLISSLAGLVDDQP